MFDNKCWVCCESCTTKNSLCKCDKDISYVHDNCLIYWIIFSQKNRCVYCGSRYKYSFRNFLYYSYCKMSIFTNQLLDTMDEFGEFLLENHIVL